MFLDKNNTVNVPLGIDLATDHEAPQLSSNRVVNGIAAQ